MVGAGVEAGTEAEVTGLTGLGWTGFGFGEIGREAIFPDEDSEGDGAGAAELGELDDDPPVLPDDELVEPGQSVVH